MLVNNIWKIFEESEYLLGISMFHYEVLAWTVENMTYDKFSTVCILKTKSVKPRSNGNVQFEL